MRFPGRRGRADEVDFHLRPLSFAETVRLKRLLDRDQEASLRDGREPTAAAVSLLFAAFADYLRHGGFLTAINDMAAHGRILPATLRTYSDWIRGDVLKRGRHEHYLREIVTAVIRRYGSQITWNNLVADMTIDHPKTVADYLQLLADMDALFILQAVREDRLCAAPKKARKVFFTDPFIFHALYDWINAGAKNGCELMEQETLADPGRTAQLVEGCAAGHCRRHFPTFYIKAGGEVDIACVAGGRLCPIEVKWTSQLRPAQLKQIKKYPNGAIWTKTRSAGAVEGLRTVPLPLALYRLPAVVTGR
jgi:predicted AAA+ superfamily ATPase